MGKIGFLSCLVVASAWGPGTGFAAEPTAKPSVKLGGFIDTYYTFDFNQPSSLDRTYGNPTQIATAAARHNEFNINLAFLEAKLTADRVRGRLAFQVGTSVQSNYSGEDASRAGLISGSSLSRHIQEAVIGYRAADKLWVEAGIYLSHIGFESFVSRDNWNYTRSLMGDFSPYYQSGVKATYEASSALSVQLHVLNGWQNVAETNSNKAVGLQVALTPTRALSVTYNNFFGEETAALSRFFNDFILKYTVTEALQVALSVDVGLQRRPTGGASTWYAIGLFGRYQVTPTLALGARLERYADPDKVIAQPVSASRFDVNGASVNADLELAKDFLWRTELRSLRASESLFSTKTGTSQQNTFVTTSLAYSF